MKQGWGADEAAGSLCVSSCVQLCAGAASGELNHCCWCPAGNCTWGMNCRFIHPGVNDKGNYSLISKPDLFASNGAPPGGPHPLIPTNPWVGGSQVLMLRSIYLRSCNSDPSTAALVALKQDATSVRGLLVTECQSCPSPLGPPSSERQLEW